MLDPVAFADDRLGFTPDAWQEKCLRSTGQNILLNCSRQAGNSNASHDGKEREMTMQTEQHSPSSSTERTRRYRERKRRGVVCVAPVPIYEDDIKALVKHRRLKPEDMNDTGKVAEVVEYLVDGWVRGELAPIRTGGEPRSGSSSAFSPGAAWC